MRCLHFFSDLLFPSLCVVYPHVTALSWLSGMSSFMHVVANYGIIMTHGVPLIPYLCPMRNCLFHHCVFALINKNHLFFPPLSFVSQKINTIHFIFFLFFFKLRTLVIRRDLLANSGCCRFLRPQSVLQSDHPLVLQCLPLFGPRSPDYPGL